MDILKRFARVFSSVTFKLALFFTAVSAATVAVFGTPGPIKTALKDSGVYNKVVSSVLSEAKKEQSTSGNSDIPLDDPAIQSVVKNALPPQFLEQTASGALDGIFGWLKGKTESPQFTVDLTSAKQQLATGIGDVAYQRASAAPVCTIAQLRTLDANNLDIFNLPCRPPGLNLEAERAKLVSQINSNDEFLKDTTITAEDLPKENGQNAFDKLAVVPTAYQWLVRTPWILGSLALLAGAAVVLLHDERRRGLWVISRTVLATGVVLIAGALVVNYLASQVRVTEGGELITVVPGVVRDLSGQFNKVLITFGIVYGVVGAGGLLVLHLTRPKLPAKQPEPLPETPVEPAKTEEPKDKVE